MINCQCSGTKDGLKIADRVMGGHTQPCSYPKWLYQVSFVSLWQVLGCIRLVFPVLGGLEEEAG